jgi:DNA invertase Pin-like site-specific DNA recombinase
VEEWVIADRAKSGGSVAGRAGLQRLVAAAKSQGCPFNCVLIDDTSRLARDLADSLRTLGILDFYDVTVVSVSNGIDSADANARNLLTMHGMMDENDLTKLAERVYRGQEGRALLGYTTGGRLYGYNNVPIEDPTRTGKYGRPEVSAVDREVNPEQAAVVTRIFTLYAQGAGQGTIAVQLNQEGVPGPRDRWSKYTVHEMLRNELYRGVSVWGRTKRRRNPETGKRNSRSAPESRPLVRKEVPKLRIISDELWLAVEARRQEAKETFHKRGGLTRTERSRTYLFSGILACEDCNGSMVICAGGGKRGYVKYGCHTHKHTGACGNRLLIRQDRLEAQLLASLERQLMDPATLDGAVGRCENELRRRLAEMQKAGSIMTVESLKKQHADMQARRDRLIQAVEVGGGDILSLTQRLREVESQMKRLADAIAAYRPVKMEVAVGSIRERVMKTLTRLHEATRAGGDLSRAKEALATHVGRLVLSPVQRDGRPVYRVQGKISVMPEAENGRMQWGAVPGHHLHYITPGRQQQQVHFA